MFRILTSQIGEFYPNNKYNILSLAELKTIIKVRRTTITNWTKEYLIIIYGYSKAIEMFKNIWSLRKESRHIAISHQYLTSFVKNRNAQLITTKEEFNLMNQIPTDRHIIIKCDKNHIFEASVTHLIHHLQWCPKCNQRFCERILRLYMESIFQVEFPETSLNKTYGIPYNKGGKLRFDGFNKFVKIFGKIFRIAFEYDGVQHDIFPNPFHKTFENFKKNNENDIIKQKIAQKEDTILIRLKEIDGFSSKTIYLFQREILKQFFELTGIKLEKIPVFKYDSQLNRIVKGSELIYQWVNTEKNKKRSNEIINKIRNKSLLFKFDREIRELRQSLEDEELYFNENYHWISDRAKQYVDQKIDALQKEIEENPNIRSESRNKESFQRHFNESKFINEDEEKDELEHKSKIETNPIKNCNELEDFEIKPFIEDSKSEYKKFDNFNSFLEEHEFQELNDINSKTEFNENQNETIIDQNGKDLDLFDEIIFNDFIMSLY